MSKRFQSEEIETDKRVHWVDVREVLKQVLVGLVRIGDVEGDDRGASSVPYIASQNAHARINLS